jgi:terminal uridylyltransferase
MNPFSDSSWSGTDAVKVWTKRRQINNPYRGTLSSYGYVLLVIYYLGHVKQPTVLP